LQHADRAGGDEDHALGRREGGDHALLLLELLQRAAPGDAGLHRGAPEGFPGRVSREGRDQVAGRRRELTMSWWTGRFQARERRFILWAALVLLPVFFLPVLPIWHMKLWAPQYREGLSLSIYSNTIKGDLQKINTLNHYVGMKAITPQ